MTNLTLSLLGGFHLEVNGVPLTAFESNKVRALLAYLTVEANRTHGRSALAGLLWPNHGEVAARANLRHVLHQLRLLLPDQPDAPPLLVVDQQTIHFNAPADSFLDVPRFNALLDRCTHCHHDTQEPCLDCIARYEQAAALYRGPFLDGLNVRDSELFDEWLIMHREQLHRQALHVFLILASFYEQVENYTQAYRYASRQIELEPWREEAHRQMMRVLTRSGQRSAALAQYERCRTMLTGVLGVEPDAATVRLYEQIRSGTFPPPVSCGSNDCVKQSTPPSCIPTSVQDWGDAPAPAYFYGRHAELAILQQWLVEERSRVVLAVSMGGMGKTTLVARSARMLAGRFDFVFWRSLINAPPLPDLLRESMLFFSRRHPTNLPESLDEQFRAFFDFMRRYRCLVILDNMEAIFEGKHAGRYRAGYEAYRQLITRMAQSEHQSCLVITSREQPQKIQQVEEDTGQVRILRLGGLEVAAGQALLKARGLAATTCLSATLVQRYSGNPLALKLAARTIQEVFNGDSTAFLGEDVLIFDDIRIVLDQQFARLSALEREILIRLALKRESVSLQVLAQNLVQAGSRRDLLEAVRSLQRRSLLEKTEAGFTLKSIVTEYVTDSIHDYADEPHKQGVVDLPYHLAMMKAQAHEYVRRRQVRLIFHPIV